MERMAWAGRLMIRNIEEKVRAFMAYLGGNVSVYTCSIGYATSKVVYNDRKETAAWNQTKKGLSEQPLRYGYGKPHGKKKELED